VFSIFEEDQIIRLYESGIQHDWKNYLTIIGGFSIRAAKTDSDEKRRVYLRAITANVEAFEKCLLEKLELTSLVNPDIPTCTDSNDIYSTLNDSIDFCFQDHQGKHVYIDELEYPTTTGSSLSLEYNDRLITSVSNNIICNAFKYANNLWVKVMGQGDHIHIEFRDDGRGMTEDELANVFSLGAKNPNALDRSTHIGMPYSKLIVEKHAGKIWCESEYGKGTSFLV
jgi:signal transduction histidine kinase